MHNMITELQYKLWTFSDYNINVDSTGTIERLWWANDNDNVEVIHVWGSEYMGNFCTFSFFAVSLKLPHKKKVKKQTNKHMF